MSADQPLRVGIIGGGIAGYSAAIALKRAGHSVEIFERRATNQQGQGITLAIAPNAGKVYQSWGFDLLAECGGVEAFQVRHIEGASAKVIWQNDWTDFPSRYGSKVIFLRHGDLHAGLERLLQTTAGPAHKITMGCDVASVNCKEARLYTSDGGCIEKDLLVVANGYSANFIQEITGHECEVQDTGLSFFRFLIPNDEVLQDHETAPLFQDEPTEICFFPLFSVGASIVTYLCEGGKTRAVNVFARHLSDKANDRGSKITRAQLLDVAKAFHPSIRAMLAKAPDDAIFSYPLFTRDPVQKYVNGKTVMIGDAAHLMRPVQGQGASIAVESTGCLEVLFAGIGKDEVQSRLALFEKLRLARCGPVHIFSNMSPTPDGYGWMLEKIKPFWDDQYTLPPPGSRPLSKPFRDFIYSYNVLEETKNALAGGYTNGGYTNGA